MGHEGVPRVIENDAYAIFFFLGGGGGVKEVYYGFVQVENLTLDIHVMAN